MNTLEQDFQQDIARVSQIPLVSTLLDVVCQTTGMRFAAIARVTEERWITCSVLDNLGFGLVPGSELEIKTTICDEIRHAQTAIVIDNVDEDPYFCDHPTPKLYSFKSYISVPIFLKDGSFFGTLCAIDPEPNKLNNATIMGMFNLFTELISFHLNATDELQLSQSRLVEEQLFSEKLEQEVRIRTKELELKNQELEQKNIEVKSFAFISSHDLQEPLRKIQAFAARITEKEQENLSDYAKDLFKRIEKSAKRMQTLINDLLDYSNADISNRKFETVSLNAILDEVKQDLKEEIEEKKAIIVAKDLCKLSVIPFQFRQVFYNLVSNALKFSVAGRVPIIKIQSDIDTGSLLAPEKLIAEKSYCHIQIADNGIGFDQEHHEKIFELFQRLHGKSEYTGTGLGLAIVKKIVQNHNGIITANGWHNEGATFNIYIPVD